MSYADFVSRKLSRVPPTGLSDVAGIMLPPGLFDFQDAIVANLARKERDANAMADALSAETRDAVMQEVTGNTRQSNPYSPARTADIPAWLVSEEAA